MFLTASMVASSEGATGRPIHRQGFAPLCAGRLGSHALGTQKQG